MMLFVCLFVCLCFLCVFVFIIYLLFFFWGALWTSESYTKWSIAERQLEKPMSNVGVVCSCFANVSPSPSIKTCTNNYQYNRAKKYWDASGNWNVGAHSWYVGGTISVHPHTHIGKPEHCQDDAQGEQVMAKRNHRRAGVGCEEHWLYDQGTWAPKSRFLCYDSKYPENWQWLCDS
jgi:hypothetical protein